MFPFSFFFSYFSFVLSSWLFLLSFFSVFSHIAYIFFSIRRLRVPLKSLLPANLRSSSNVRLTLHFHFTNRPQAISWLFREISVIAKTHTVHSLPHKLVYSYRPIEMWEHVQKPHFVFRRNGRVHLNWQGRQFSRLLAAEVCASAVVMLDKPCSELVWRVLVTHSILLFPFTSPSVRYRMPSHFSLAPQFFSKF